MVSRPWSQTKLELEYEAYIIDRTIKFKREGRNCYRGVQQFVNFWPRVRCCQFWSDYSHDGRSWIRISIRDKTLLIVWRCGYLSSCRISCWATTGSAVHGILADILADKKSLLMLKRFIVWRRSKFLQIRWFVVGLQYMESIKANQKLEAAVLWTPKALLIGLRKFTKPIQLTERAIQQRERHNWTILLVSLGLWKLNVEKQPVEFEKIRVWAKKLAYNGSVKWKCCILLLDQKLKEIQTV